jgi:MHS family proline/betaine transporter-like MFS transporter
MLIGGFAPFYLTWLSHTFDPMLAPMFYVMAAALVSFIGTLFLRKTYCCSLFSSRAI